MIWDDFYDRVFDWADSTVKTKISSLEDIGPGEDIVEVILNLSDDKVKAQLIRKAMKLGAVFSQDDFANLDGELSEDLYAELASYTRYDPIDPWFDEDNMTWDDFYAAYSDWSDEVTARRVQKLRHFGPSDEVCDAINGMPTLELSDVLFDKAVACGVKFSTEQLRELGRIDLLIADAMDNMPSDDDIKQLEENVASLCDQLEEINPANTKPRKPGFWGWVGAFALALAGAGPAKKKDTGHCDGDCANCPAHYGYRYGRWYYGHGHQHGCQRGGNGGASGRCNRD